MIMMILESKRYFLCVTAALATLISHVYADVVSIDDFNARQPNLLTQREFEAAQQSAGDGGTIIFSNRTYRTQDPLSVTKTAITLRGKGKNNTIIMNEKVGSSPSVFVVSADNVSFKRMTIRGKEFVQTEFPTALRGGARASVGVENGIGIDANNNGVGLSVDNVIFKRVNVGIEYRSGAVPSGMSVKRSQFSTVRAMILAVDSERAPAITLTRPLEIIGNVFVKEDGQAAPGRGIVFDFGNSFIENPVDLKGSIIMGNNIGRMERWNLGLNRVEDIDVIGNIFGGGGLEQRSVFVHCIHLEDRSRNITVAMNRCNQRRRNGNNILIRNAAHIWSGGNNGAAIVNLVDNVFTGRVFSSIQGNLANWSINNNNFDLPGHTGFIINNFGSNNTSGSTARVFQANGNVLNGALLQPSSTQFKLGRDR